MTIFDSGVPIATCPDKNVRLATFSLEVLKKRRRSELDDGNGLRQNQVTPQAPTVMNFGAMKSLCEHCRPKDNSKAPSWTWKSSQCKDTRICTFFFLKFENKICTKCLTHLFNYWHFGWNLGLFTLFPKITKTMTKR